MGFFSFYICIIKIYFICLSGNKKLICMKTKIINSSMILAAVCAIILFTTLFLNIWDVIDKELTKKIGMSCVFVAAILIIIAFITILTDNPDKD